MNGPTTPALPRLHRFRLFPVRSPLLRESIFLSLPGGTEMFQFPPFALTLSVTGLQPAGLPHSEITGSKHVCSSPALIAAYHVLLRLQKPRHPPFALVTFSLYDLNESQETNSTLVLVLLVALKLQSTTRRQTLYRFFLSLQTINFFFFTLPRYLSQTCQ